METATTTKPKYLGLLNAISNGESAAGVYLEAWADVTPNADLACTQRLVAARERSHGDVFCRRIAELGYSLRKKVDPRGAETLAKLANPNISDLEKVGDRQQGDGDGDFFGDIRRKIAEGEFDPMTANLMTWYIAEERDTISRLRDCCVLEGLPRPGEVDDVHSRRDCGPDEPVRRHRQRLVGQDSRFRLRAAPPPGRGPRGSRQLRRLRQGS